MKTIICAVAIFILIIFCASTRAFTCDFKDINNVHTCIITDGNGTTLTNVSEKNVLRVVVNVTIPKTLVPYLFSTFKNMTTLEIPIGDIGSYETGVFPTEECILTNLQISKSQIVSLPSRALSSCSSLINIDFSNNNITDVSNTAFNGIQDVLKSLNLAKNKVSIESGIFSNNVLPVLTSLNLSSNGITSFPNPGFAFPSTVLTKLDLSFNNFTAIANTTLNLVSSLEELYLNNNAMTEISDSQFSKLKALKELNIGNNKIISIHKDAFKLNTNLEKLIITGLTINTLDIELFTPLTKLKHLDIQDIKITSTSTENLKAILLALTDLTYLNINMNNIGSIDGIFSANKNLIELFINEIGLERISEDAFENLTKLEVISMNSNNLRSFPDNIFRNTVELKALHLRNNKISLLKTSVFEKLNKLEYLDLTGNEIKGIQRNFFDKLGNLKVVKMSNNICLNEETLNFATDRNSSLTKFEKCFNDFNSSNTLIISNILLFFVLLLKFV